MSEGFSVGAAGKALGWVSRGARWFNEWLARFRAPFAVESCVGAYWEGHGPQRDWLLIRYALQLVNREASPNSVHAISFRFRHREVGSAEVPDLRFSGLNIGPRATESYGGEVELSESVLQFGAGEARILGGDVIVTPAYGKTAEGTFMFHPGTSLPQQQDGRTSNSRPAHPAR